MQKSVELGLTHILHQDNQDSLMHKVHSSVQTIRFFVYSFHCPKADYKSKNNHTFLYMDVCIHLTIFESGHLNLSVSSLQLYQRMAMLRSLCSLHMEKLRWFSQRYPLISHSLFPPLYKELFASEAELLPGTNH